MARIAPELLDPARYPFRHEMTTRFADVDPNHHVNNVAMAAAFEDARVRFDAWLGIPFLQRKHRTMIAANDIAYLAEAHYPDPLVMHVAGLAIGRTSWTLASIAVQGGRVCGFSQAVMVGTEDGHAVPVDETFRRALEGAMLNP